MSKVVHCDEKNFNEEVLISETPVLVEFSAEWCGPCKRQLPILEELASKNNVKIISIDIDNSPSIAQQFGIRGVPSLVLFNHGQKVNSTVGLTSLKDLEVLINCEP